MYYGGEYYFSYPENGELIFYSCKTSSQALNKLRELRHKGICGNYPIKRIMWERRRLRKMRKYNYRQWKECYQ